MYPPLASMMSIVEATRKKKSHATSLTSLPEEIMENIIARVSRWNYPKLSLVSKTFHSLLSSMNIYKTRSHIGTTETFLFICLQSIIDKSTQWFTLRAKPNRVRARTITKQFKRRSSGNVLVPTIPSSNRVPVTGYNTATVGSEIYTIGELPDSDCEPSSTVIWVLDCRSHTWRNAPNMKVARKAAEVVSLHEKIYVMGGCDQSTNCVEVFDIKTQSWTFLPSPRDISGEYFVVNAIQGKLHVVTKSKEYIYDPEQGTWKVVREPSISDQIETCCVVENIICCCTEEGDCMWYDTKGDKCEMIKGLEKLREHPQHGFSDGFVHDLVNYGDNILIIWQPKECHKETKFWYAEISLETRCKGSEVWGNIDWVDIMFTLPYESDDIVLHCFNISV